MCTAWKHVLEMYIAQGEHYNIMLDLTLLCFFMKGPIMSIPQNMNREGLPCSVQPIFHITCGIVHNGRSSS